MHIDLADFEALYESHGPRMKSLALNMLGNVSDAEDAIQEAFLRAYRHRQSFRGDAGLWTWFYRILLNACHDITLVTSFSPIRIRLREGASYALNAKVAFGRIDSDIPVTGAVALNEGSLSGRIGGGACSLRATTTNGDIRIEKLAGGR